MKVPLDLPTGEPRCSMHGELNNIRLIDASDSWKCNDPNCPSPYFTTEEVVDLLRAHALDQEAQLERLDYRVRELEGRLP